MDAIFEITLRADAAAVEPALDQSIAFLEAHGGNDKSAFRVRLALDELLANIVMHGQPGPDPVEVRVRLWIEPPRVVCEVSDTGPAFDPLSAPEPDVDATLEDRPIGGLGLHLVRSMIPELSYRRANNRNIVRLSLPLASDE